MHVRLTWRLWRRKPKILVRVDDEFTIARLGTVQRVRIIGINQRFIYYRTEHGTDDLATYGEFRRAICDPEVSI